MTITNLSPRSQLTDHWIGWQGDIHSTHQCHGNDSHPVLAPITRQFRTRAAAYGIIGVLLVSRGHGHVWREGFLIGFICFDGF